MPIVQNLLPALTELTSKIDWLYTLKTALLIGAAVCILGGVFRLICGKGSKLVRSVSGSVILMLVYLADILVYVFAPSLRDILAPLPFLTVTEDAFFLWDICSLRGNELYIPLLQLFLLAFFANLLDGLMPKGKKLLSWYGFRLLTVAACLALYTMASSLIRSVAPRIFGDWAGYILLGIWGVILLTGILKLLLTVILAAVNPLVGALYGFFFSNIVGKQLSQAIATTLLTVAIMCLLYWLGYIGFAFDGFSIAAYGPVCLVAALILYLFGKLL